MDRLYVYIVEKDFPFAATRIAGDTPLGHLKKAFKAAPVGKAPREDVPSAEYVAVVPSDMPLVTKERLLSLTDEMERRAVSALEIGSGGLWTRDAYLRGEAPKRRFENAEIRALSSRAELYEAERILYRKNAEFCVQNGAIIPDVQSVRIDVKSTVYAGAEVMPYTVITGCEVRAGATIGSFSVLDGSFVDEGARVLSSYVKDSTIGKNSTVGPYAYVRMGSAIGDGCRIGDFVEVKRSRVADGAKAAHLAYIGDAEIGVGTNVGCGTVFANYDGREKHKTKVGSRVFIGANTNLIAPLTVGDDVFIAAATTVTRDIPAGRFVIGRPPAEIKEKK